MGILGIITALILMLLISPFAFISSRGYVNTVAERRTKDALNRAAKALMQYYLAPIPGDPYRTYNRFPNTLDELVTYGFLQSRDLYDGWNRRLVYIVSGFNSSLTPGARPSGTSTQLPAAVVISVGRNGVLNTSINPSNLNAVTALSLMPQGDDLAAFAIPLSTEIGRTKTTYKKMHRLAQASFNCYFTYGSYPTSISDIKTKHGLSEEAIRDAWGYTFRYTIQNNLPVISLGP
ncbi:MAG: hypothetical protein QW650_00965 [Thermofilum sp.]